MFSILENHAKSFATTIAPIKNIIGCICLLLVTTQLHAQESWQLKKEEDGIKVYTTEVQGSRFKKVKVTCTIDATLSQLTALIMDAPAHEQWVYNTKNSYVIRQIDAQHQLYYSETNLPWPMTNRDVVVDMTLRQNALTKNLQITGNSVVSDVPPKKGIVRVPMSQVNWSVTPISDHLLQVEYFAQVDPGGSIPSWIVNSFIAKGPLQTFINLRKLVKTETYQRAQYAFIQN